MARFCTFCSSSSGNCTYVGTASYGVLIDAGTNNKQITMAMENVGISPDSVKAIFVTHEHNDHVSAVKVFAGKRNIPVYATGGTLSGLMNSGILDTGKFPYEKLKPEGIMINDMHISYFNTYHDSKEPCGYIIELPDAKIGICTDTGKTDNNIIRRLCECNLVLLESNYDEQLLDFGPYPLDLKARIRSDYGHLSNVNCANTVAELFESGVRKFVLGHISKENNTPDRAFSCTNSILKRMGAVRDRDYILETAPVKSMDKIITL